MNKILLSIYFVSFSLLAKAQTVDFTYQTSDGLFCNPSTVEFTQTSTGNPTAFVWTFGDGQASNSSNPTITYSNPGSYTVKLIAIYEGTTAVVTKTIVISPAITTSIGYDRNYICTAGVINFTAATNGNIARYDWDFGDGSPVETTSAGAIAHNFAAPGAYLVTVQATAVSGCVGTAQTTITFQNPPLNGTVSPTSGCIPANVRFSVNAQIPVGSSVTKYSWDFNDGSPVISTPANGINHIFGAPGNFSPLVTITTNEGCASSYNYGAIGYGTPPFNHTAYPRKTVICGSDAAAFVSKATNANSYLWDFGDGKTAIVPDTMTSHKYDSLGIKNVTVTPVYNGCTGTPITFQITVVGVIATYKYSNTCIDKKTFSFTNTSQGNLSSVSWDFGDGSPVENTLNTTHTFPTSGSFVSTLTVTDNITGCIDIYSRTIYTAGPSLANADSSICKNDSTTFSIVNNYSDTLAYYTWMVAGKQVGPVKASSLKVSASLLGNFNNYVSIDNGIQYCRDTIRLNHTILVRGPALSFTTASSICIDTPYIVTNTSKPFRPQDSVILWYWNFGEHNVADTGYQPPSYLYNKPGTYKVKLTGIDINGCKDTLVKNIIVRPLPFLYVIPAIDTFCTGQLDTLFAFHNGSIIWSPSNSLSCNTCDTVLTNPAVDTKYHIKAVTIFGCNVSDSVLVKAYPPFVATPVANDPYICLNDTIQLNIDPPGKKIIWSPAAGLSNANGYGPIASPTQNTTYTATLTDSVGCFTSTANINVHIKSLPTVDAGPDKVYPFNSSFTITPAYSNNVSSYSWTPFGILSCNTCPNPNGTTTTSNTFIIKVTSDSGCVAKDEISIFVECKEANLLMPNAFTPNYDNINDFFYPLTRGIKSIIRFSIYNRFGKLAFEAKNFPPNSKAFGWNGQINNIPQSSDVYVYYIEALCDVGEKLYSKGSFMLIR